VPDKGFIFDISSDDFKCLLTLHDYLSGSEYWFRGAQDRFGFQEIDVKISRKCGKHFADIPKNIAIEQVIGLLNGDPCVFKTELFAEVNATGR
jgi:hypothetical protein